MKHDYLRLVPDIYHINKYKENLFLFLILNKNSIQFLVIYKRITI